MIKKIFKVSLIAAIVLAALSTTLMVVPNPLRNKIIGEAKAAGYIEYTPMEAYNMARFVCTQCHSDERIKKYCERCGPPFIAVVPHMQSFIDNYKITKPNLHLTNITEPQAAAIVQVWNAVIGNWEKDFREQDMLKLIGHYDRLKALYYVPISKRPIESALLDRNDLKVGYMNDAMKSAKEGPKDAAPAAPGMEGHDHEHMHEHEHGAHSGM